jgi:hypothetical protein
MKRVWVPLPETGRTFRLLPIVWLIVTSPTRSLNFLATCPKFELLGISKPTRAMCEKGPRCIGPTDWPHSTTHAMTAPAKKRGPKPGAWGRVSAAKNSYSHTPSNERGEHSAAAVVAKAQAVLSEPELLRAMFDVGYFPPDMPPDAEP